MHWSGSQLLIKLGLCLQAIPLICCRWLPLGRDLAAESSAGQGQWLGASCTPRPLGVAKSRAQENRVQSTMGLLRQLDSARNSWFCFPLTSTLSSILYFLSEPPWPRPATLTNQGYLLKTFSPTLIRLLRLPSVVKKLAIQLWNYCVLLLWFIMGIFFWSYLSYAQKLITKDSRKIKKIKARKKACWNARNFSKPTSAAEPVIQSQTSYT